MKAVKLAIFASGRGSNAEAILQFQSQANYEVALIVVSRSEALVTNLAREKGIPLIVLEKERFQQEILLLESLNEYGIELICLAGFLWKIPDYLIKAFPERIINIHPSLLPKYGGKGMYGSKVHEAVVASGERESGITIHLVNEEYDKGKILFQAKVPVYEKDTAADLASRVLALEHKHFPTVIQTLCNSLKKSTNNSLKP
ncbi:phosphoribosylglycinamide formyltransferase [Chitinophagales bacterium]|jgi:phosphoribosylglycinamide formyltransferase-1|nr:phosphoribosylglycinamide formyltransferase [Chitinophagales bacterium]